MTPKMIRDLDQKTAALKAAVGDVIKIMRTVAEDPDQTEGALRDHLRQGAQFAEQLQKMNDYLIAANRRAGIRFGVLAILFGLLSAAWWFRILTGGPNL